MAMTGVASRFAFFDLEFAIISQSVTNGENEQSGETTNPHYVRGQSIPTRLQKNCLEQLAR